MQGRSWPKKKAGRVHHCSTGWFRRSRPRSQEHTSRVGIRLQLKPNQLLRTHPPPLQAKNVYLMYKRKKEELRSGGDGFVLCLHRPITTVHKGTVVLEISRDTFDNYQESWLLCERGVLLEQCRWWNGLSLPHQCARWAVPCSLGVLSFHTAWLRSPFDESLATSYDIDRGNSDVNDCSHQLQLLPTASSIAKHRLNWASMFF